MSLRSSPRKRRPPAHLAPAGAKLWRDVVDEYRVQDTAGLALVTCAAECVDRMRAAQVVIDRDGEVVKDRYGAAKLNPACALEKDARNGFIAAMKALNFAFEPPGKGAFQPSSRSK